MPHSLDISWPVLRKIVRDWAGESVELAEVARLCGGTISTALCLTLADGNRAVLKITPHRVDRTYEDEKHQLALCVRRTFRYRRYFDVIPAPLTNRSATS